MNLESEEVIIYTDGSCIKEKGGYGLVVIIGTIYYIVNGYIGKSTSSRAELIAVIKALYLFRYTRLVIYTDSQYVYNGYNTWSSKWIENGYKKLKNIDLWKRILLFKLNNRITINWIRRSYNSYNIIADKYAKEGVGYE